MINLVDKILKSNIKIEFDYKPIIKDKPLFVSLICRKCSKEFQGKIGRKTCGPCYSSYIKSENITSKITKEGLVNLLYNNSCSKIAELYNVSLSLVAKWVKKFDIKLYKIKKNSILSTKIKKDLCSCGKMKTFISKTCSKCFNSLDRKSVKNNIYPRKEIIHWLIWNYPSLLISKQLNISDSYLCKLCKKLKLEKPTRGYWNKMKEGLINDYQI